MLHESEEKEKIVISDSTLSFSEIYKKTYFPKEYEEDIKNANVLVIPYEGFREYSKPIFPEETKFFLEYLRDKSSDLEVTPDICISDEEFLELELHADVVNIPELIVTLAVLPIITSIIGSYLYDKLKTRKTSLKANIDINVEYDGRVKKIHYKGDADKFEGAVKAVSKQLFK